MDLETLRAEVRKRHPNAVSLSGRDPILTVATIFEIVQIDALEQVRTAVEKAEAAASAAAALRLKEAHKIGEDIVTQGSDFVRQGVREEFEQGRLRLAEQVEAGVGRLSRRRQVMEWMELATAVLVGFFLHAAITWLFSALR